MWGPVGLAADGQHAYTNGFAGVILRLNLDGTARETYGDIYAGTSPGAWGAIAVDANLLYWSAGGSIGSGIGRGGLDGSYLNPAFIRTPVVPAQVAVDQFGSNRPASLGPPRISGRAIVGQKLYSSTGAWSGSSPILFNYQWQRCGSACANIPAATTAAYKLGSADEGSRIRVVVTATNADGSAQAAATTTAGVAPAPLRRTQIRATLRTLAVADQ